MADGERESGGGQASAAPGSPGQPQRHPKDSAAEGEFPEGTKAHAHPLTLRNLVLGVTPAHGLRRMVTANESCTNGHYRLGWQGQRQAWRGAGENPGVMGGQASGGWRVCEKGAWGKALKGTMGS